MLLNRIRTALGLALAGAALSASAAAPAKYTIHVAVPGLVATPLAVAPVDPVDPYFANVRLLIHTNSATLTDVKGSTVTSYGTNAFTTAQKLFGAGSITFAGNGRALTAPPFQPQGDFTVEGWIYPVPMSAAYSFLDIGGIANVNWQPQSLYVDTNGALMWYASSTNNGTDVSGGSGCGSGCNKSVQIGALTMNAWNHFAVERSGAQYLMYVNGSRTAVISNSRALYTSAYKVVIGNYANGSQTGFYGGFPGYLTELRLTDGVARYTGSTYSVPTAAFPDK